MWSSISACAASGGSGAKIRCLLTFWELSVFDFHGEDSDRMSWWLRSEGYEWRIESSRGWRLVCDSRLVAAASASRSGSTGGEQSLVFQVENIRYDLNWLCLAMALFKVLFERTKFLQDENLRYMIRRWCHLCTVSFLETSRLENLNSMCCLDGGFLVVCAATTRNWSL
jgi:hypothetical protein